MPSGMQLLNMDSVERVQTTAEMRSEILAGFDCCSASGVEFEILLIGVRYRSVAGWL